MNKPQVLIVSEGRCLAAKLVERLESQGCECHFAFSFAEAIKSIRERSFDLVLGPVRMRDGSIYGLLDSFDGTRTSVFYSHAVDDGCWWLPAVRRGVKCFGERALRAGEFVPVLDEVVAEACFESA